MCLRLCALDHGCQCTHRVCACWSVQTALYAPWGAPLQQAAKHYSMTGARPSRPGGGVTRGPRRARRAAAPAQRHPDAAHWWLHGGGAGGDRRRGRKRADTLRQRRRERGRRQLPAGARRGACRAAAPAMHPAPRQPASDINSFACAAGPAVSPRPQCTLRHGSQRSPSACQGTPPGLQARCGRNAPCATAVSRRRQPPLGERWACRLAMSALYPTPCLTAEPHANALHFLCCKAIIEWRPASPPAPSSPPLPAQMDHPDDDASHRVLNVHKNVPGVQARCGRNAPCATADSRRRQPPLGERWACRLAMSTLYPTPCLTAEPHATARISFAARQSFSGGLRRRLHHRAPAACADGPPRR